MSAVCFTDRNKLGTVVKRPWDELTDAEWQAIAPLLPGSNRMGRRRSTDLRGVVAAINFHWQTGCPWRRLPASLPPWPTVYSYFRRWLKDGTLRKLRAVLSPPTLSGARTVRRIEQPATRLDPDRDQEGSWHRITSR